MLSRLTDMSIDDATGTIGVGGGAPPRKALTAYMGHASITITLDRYGHLLPGGEDEAADLLDRYLERGASRG